MGVTVSSSHVGSATPSSSGEDSSPSAPAPVWGPTHGRQFPTNFSSMSPSHGLQFFTNCSSVGPFHRVQSFRYRLLQCGTPKGSQALRENLISPRGHRSWQVSAPAQAPHGVTDSFRHPPAPVWGPTWAAGGNLLHHGPPWAAGAQPASPQSAPQAAGEPLLWRLEHLLPSFCTDLGGCRVVALTYSHSSILMDDGDGLGLGQQWVHLGAWWYWLYWTWGKLPAASHRSHPCSAPTTRTLPRKPSTACT